MPSQRSTSAGSEARASGSRDARLVVSRTSVAWIDRHAEGLRPADVLAQAVADHHGLGRRDSRLGERGFEDHRARLPLADLGRQRDRVEPLEQADLGEELTHQLRWVEERSRQARPSDPRSRSVSISSSDARLELVMGTPDEVLGDDEAVHRIRVGVRRRATRAAAAISVGVVDLVLPLGPSRRGRACSAEGLGEDRLARARRRRTPRGRECGPRRRARSRTPRRRGCCPSRRRLPGSRGG